MPAFSVPEGEPPPQRTNSRQMPFWGLGDSAKLPACPSPTYPQKVEHFCYELADKAKTFIVPASPHFFK